MKHTFKFPTFLGLLFLIAVLVIGVLLVQRQQRTQSSAQETVPAPGNIAISNVTDQSFVVSWTTDAETVGFIKAWKLGESSTRRISDDRDRENRAQQSYATHYLTVDNLSPATSYQFQIGEGENSLFGQNNQPFSQQTAPVLSSLPSPDTAQGVVKTPSGEPAGGAIVYAKLQGAQLLSGLVSSSGNWIIPFSTLRRLDLTDWANFNANSTVYALSVEGGTVGKAEATLTTGLDRPVPPIVLGQRYDFRQSREPVEKSLPLTQPGSNFSLFDFSVLGPVTPVAADVVIENPKNDRDILYTDKPEFFGKGPKNTQLDIVVESSQTITGGTTVSPEGAWTFHSPTLLSPGEHTITISWVDSQGIQQTTERTFVVTASGTKPAFTASPSARPTVKPTVPPRTSQPSTASGTMRPGTLTPTAVLFTIGVILTLAGLIISHRAYGH